MLREDAQKNDMKMNLFIILNLFFSLNTYSSIVEIAREEMRKSHRPINYKQANEILFTKLDNHKGTICSVYSPAICLMTTVVPSPKIMNIEHTWPQSEGANGDAKSDLHHLYITDSATNSMRSSLPFCDVVTLKWTNGESKRGYNKSNIHCFEPPQSHKGNVARSIFYFSIRYNHELDQEQEACLRAWDKIDPVTEDEILRTKLIESYQGNLNPFITDPTLIDKIPKF